MNNKISVGVIQQNLTVLRPSDQEVLPVPLTDWNTIQARIVQINSPTTRLEAWGWASIGASISFLIVTFTLPFSVEWSKIISNVEHINWPAILTEGSSIALTLVFLGVGLLSLYWANEKQKTQAKMGDWLVQDMKNFQNKHSAVSK